MAARNTHHARNYFLKNKLLLLLLFGFYAHNIYLHITHSGSGIECKSKVVRGTEKIRARYAYFTMYEIDRRFRNKTMKIETYTLRVSHEKQTLSRRHANARVYS